MKKITFGSVDEYFFEDKEVHPQPIKQYIPDWFKQMGQRIDDAYVGAPNYENRTKAKTIKACPSFVELWDEGFVIPAPLAIIYCNGSMESSIGELGQHLIKADMINKKSRIIGTLKWLMDFQRNRQQELLLS